MVSKDFNYSDKHWREINVSELVNTFAVDILSYFEELDDEEAVCTLFLNDVHIESQVENVALIRNAPNMYRLLEQSRVYLPPKLAKEWDKILKDLNRKLISGQ